MSPMPTKKSSSENQLLDESKRKRTWYYLDEVRAVAPHVRPIIDHHYHALIRWE